MTALNLGQIPDAVSALQTFMKLAPSDPEGCAGAVVAPCLAADAAEVEARRSQRTPVPRGLHAPATLMPTIADRLAGIRERMAAAARSAGRDPSSIRLVAVSKTFPIDAIREAYAAGHRDFGENRVQEALQKIASATDLEIRWHLLGHLQLEQGPEGRAGIYCDSFGGQPRAAEEARCSGGGGRADGGTVTAGGPGRRGDEVRRVARRGASIARRRGRMPRRQGNRVDDSATVA